MLLSELNKERINYIKYSNFYKPMVDFVKKKADEFLDMPEELLKFSDYNIYYITGSRKEYEKVYFRRRGMLNSYAFLYLITEEEKYKTALEDIIWAICDEYSWALPAHMENDVPVANQKVWIDLFAAETGFALSEIYDILGEKLSEKVSERLVYEVRIRIIESYLNQVNTYFWEKSDNNWSAVCAGSVGSTLMYLATEEEFEMALPRILDTISCFLSGYNDDGCCLEGLSYWNYGFGFFLFFADLLKRFTNNKINLLDDKKVETIALYQQKVILSRTSCVGFSDGRSVFKHQIGISHYLYKNFKDVEIPDISRIKIFGDDSCYRWAAFIRDFIWSDDKLPHCTITEKNNYYFKDAQWFIKRGNKYSFAAKGGHNNEPHNHNDIGSFMCNVNDKFILDDFGAGEYTEQYFNPAYRYKILVNSSRGHSVPIINGESQNAGEDYCGYVLETNENRFRIDISKAYNLSELNSLIRDFTFTDDGIYLKDSFKFSKPPKSLTERFVTGIKPVLKGNIVDIGGHIIKFDTDLFDCYIKKEVYMDHSSKPATAYLIDFSAKHLDMFLECQLYIQFLL